MIRDELSAVLENDMGHVRKYREKEKEYNHLDSYQTRMVMDQKNSRTK